MIIYYKSISSIFFLFFLVAIFYWSPFLDTQFIALFKFLILIILFSSFIFFKKYLNLSKFQVAFSFFMILWAIMYEVFLDMDLSYLKIVILSLIFYSMGVGTYFEKNKNYPLYSFLLTITSLWVFLSFFYPNLNYQNNLLVDYEYSEVMLSSSGFSLGRTGWGIAIFFVSLFFINFLKSNLLKTIIFILGFLSVCTTGSRGGELYFFLSILFYIGYYLKDLKVKILFFVAMFLFFGYIYFSLGEVLRLSNNDDFFNGRIISGEVVYRLLTDHFLFGYYSVGGYSLDSFGVGYKEIHNAWLNFFIKYGLLGSIPMFLFLGYGLKGIFHNKKYFKDNLSLYLIIIVGIVSTFLEPETIFSYGYHILIFWFTLGYLSKNKTC